MIDTLKLAFLEGFASLCNEVTSEIRPADPEQWDSRKPFHNHFYCSCMIADNVELPSLEEIVDMHLMPSMIAMAQQLNETPIMQCRELPIYAVWGAVQKLYTYDNLSARFTAQYDAIRQGTRITVDMLMAMDGNVFYPIINGPMHGMLFPFVKTLDDGDEFTFDYHLEPRHDFVLFYDPDTDNEVKWPGLDPQFERIITRHRYRFVMPYVYYLGETVLTMSDL